MVAMRDQGKQTRSHAVVVNAWAVVKRLTMLHNTVEQLNIIHCSFTNACTDQTVQIIEMT
jgi:hypothetical protein